ncbi:unnamed protein product [Lasius platythorax]|uniref:Uncharacterized protein n=1 Tax=Lasius platythorax TaxID=488582 RepID=A0AAV2N3A7_9HYME
MGKLRGLKGSRGGAECRKRPAADRDDGAHGAAPGTRRQLREIAEEPINFAVDKQRFKRIHRFRCIASDH